MLRDWLDFRILCWCVSITYWNRQISQLIPTFIKESVWEAVLASLVAPQEMYLPGLGRCHKGKGLQTRPSWIRAS